MAGVGSFRSFFVLKGSCLGPTTVSGSTFRDHEACCNVVDVIYTANANSESPQANIFIIYADAQGSNVTLSSRYVDLEDPQLLFFINSTYNSHHCKYYKHWLSISVALLHVKVLGQ